MRHVLHYVMHHVALQERLLALRERGVLLCLCSRNEPVRRITYNYKVRSIVRRSRRATCH